MASARRIALGLGLAVGAAPVQAQDMGLTLEVSGAVQATAQVGHDVDAAHFCSAAPNPWVRRDDIDDRATPYPFYRVVFGQIAPEDEPAAPGPSLGMALSNYFAAARDHRDPARDSIELTMGGRHFVGHGGLDDPEYRLAVNYRDDGQGGGFVAHHLHESGTGDGTIDVAGSWHCPPVMADLSVRQILPHRLFAGATPVRAEPTHLRLSHAGTPCRPRDCAPWQVIDQGTGEAFLARVDFRRLRLVKPLRRQAESGQVVLLVDGDVAPGDPPCVVPRLLAGVLPQPQDANQQAAMQATLAR